MPTTEHIIDANIPDATPAVSTDGFDQASFQIAQMSSVALTTAAFQPERSSSASGPWVALGSPIAQSGASSVVSIDGVAFVRIAVSTIEGSAGLARAFITIERKP